MSYGVDRVVASHPSKRTYAAFRVWFEREYGRAFLGAEEETDVAWEALGRFAGTFGLSDVQLFGISELAGEDCPDD